MLVVIYSVRSVHSHGLDESKTLAGHPAFKSVHFFQAISRLKRMTEGKLGHGKEDQFNLQDILNCFTYTEARTVISSKIAW